MKYINYLFYVHSGHVFAYFIYLRMSLIESENLIQARISFKRKFLEDRQPFLQLD